MKKVLALVLAMFVIIGLVGCAGGDSGKAASGKLKIGISLPTQREERWVLDKEAFEKVAAEAGVDISIQIADNDAARQQSQCENLISQGISVLIIAPHDADAAANIVEMAHAAKIPVISYDRLVQNSDVDLYVTFDQYKIGQLMGEYVNEHVEKGNIVVLSGDPQDPTCVPLKKGAIDAIKGKIDSGAFKIVTEQECKDWQPSEALKHMENALTANNNDIAAVIAPNDGTAGGCIQALAAQGLDGKVVVTGQDSEVDAIKRIIEGTQSMTVFFDVRDMAKAAFDAAVKMAGGESAANIADTFENNGKIDVPTLGFPASQVTKDTYKALVIDSGYMSEDDLK